MAYLVYITRGPHFDSALRRRIMLGELVRALEGDEELVPAFDVQALGNVPPERQVVRYQKKDGQGWGSLCLHAGNVASRNPDEPTLEKMIELAGRLHAQVQGEDNECYEESTGRPFLVQAGLFHEASRRLRVRFPTVVPPEPTGAKNARNKTIGQPATGQQIRMKATEETLRAAENAIHVVEAQKQLTGREVELEREPKITINGTEVRRVLGKMSLPKLNGERKTSAAIEALLNPIKQAL